MQRFPVRCLLVSPRLHLWTTSRSLVSRRVPSLAPRAFPLASFPPLQDAPGPGSYALVPSTGHKQPASNIHTASSWGFGTSERFNKVSKSSSGTPGPGTYVV